MSLFEILVGLENCVIICLVVTVFFLSCEGKGRESVGQGSGGGRGEGGGV